MPGDLHVQFRNRYLSEIVGVEFLFVCLYGGRSSPKYLLTLLFAKTPCFAETDEVNLCKTRKELALHELR